MPRAQRDSIGCGIPDCRANARSEQLRVLSHRPSRVRLSVCESIVMDNTGTTCYLGQQHQRVLEDAMQHTIKSIVVVCLFAFWSAIWSGCHSAKPVIGPGGQEETAIALSCDVESDCLEDAGKACPGGYRVLSKDRRFSVWSWTWFSTQMLVVCGSEKSAQSRL